MKKISWVENGLNKKSELDVARQFQIYQTCGNDRVDASINTGASVEGEVVTILF